MLFKQMIALYAENHTKLITAFYGKIKEIMNAEVGGTYIYQCTVKN